MSDTYLHTNTNKENYLLTPSDAGDLCVAKLYPSQSSNGSASAHSVRCEASRNLRWTINNTGIQNPVYKLTLPNPDQPQQDQPLFQVSKPSPHANWWTLFYFTYAGHLIPPKRIEFGQIQRNAPEAGGGTRVSITGKTEDEKAVWKTLGESNEDMVEWIVICAALVVLDNEIVTAATLAGINAGVLPNDFPTKPEPASSASVPSPRIRTVSAPNSRDAQRARQSQLAPPPMPSSASSSGHGGFGSGSSKSRQGPPEPVHIPSPRIPPSGTNKYSPTGRGGAPYDSSPGMSFEAPHPGPHQHVPPARASLELQQQRFMSPQPPPTQPKTQPQPRPHLTPQMQPPSHQRRSPTPNSRPNTGPPPSASQAYRNSPDPRHQPSTFSPPPVLQQQQQQHYQQQQQQQQPRFQEPPPPQQSQSPIPTSHSAYTHPSSYHAQPAQPSRSAPNSRGPSPHPPPTHHQSPPYASYQPPPSQERPMIRHQLSDRPIVRHQLTDEPPKQRPYSNPIPDQNPSLPQAKQHPGHRSYERPSPQTMQQSHQSPQQPSRHHHHPPPQGAPGSSSPTRGLPRQQQPQEPRSAPQVQPSAVSKPQPAPWSAQQIKPQNPIPVPTPSAAKSPPVSPKKPGKEKKGFSLFSPPLSSTKNV